MPRLTEGVKVPNRGRPTNKARAAKAEALPGTPEVKPESPLDAAEQFISAIMGIEAEDIDDIEEDEFDAKQDATLDNELPPETPEAPAKAQEPEIATETDENPENGSDAASEADEAENGAEEPKTTPGREPYALAGKNKKRKTGHLGNTRDLRVSARHMCLALRALESNSGFCEDGTDCATRIGGSEVALSIKEKPYEGHRREVVTIPEYFLVKSYRTD